MAGEQTNIYPGWDMNSAGSFGNPYDGIRNTFGSVIDALDKAAARNNESTKNKLDYAARMGESMQRGASSFMQTAQRSEETQMSMMDRVAQRQQQQAQFDEGTRRYNQEWAYKSRMLDAQAGMAEANRQTAINNAEFGRNATQACTAINDRLNEISLMPDPNERLRLARELQAQTQGLSQLQPAQPIIERVDSFVKSADSFLDWTRKRELQQKSPTGDISQLYTMLYGLQQQAQVYKSSNNKEMLDQAMGQIAMVTQSINAWNASKTPKGTGEKLSLGDIRSGVTGTTSAAGSGTSAAPVVSGTGQGAVSGTGQWSGTGVNTDLTDWWKKRFNFSGTGN